MRLSFLFLKLQKLILDSIHGVIRNKVDNSPLPPTKTLTITQHFEVCNFYIDGTEASLPNERVASCYLPLKALLVEKCSKCQNLGMLYLGIIAREPFVALHLLWCKMSSIYPLSHEAPISLFSNGCYCNILQLLWTVLKQHLT